MNRVAPVSAIDQARANRCSALQAGKCRNGFKIMPYCVGQLHPERTPRHLWPECLDEDGDSAGEEKRS